MYVCNWAQTKLLQLNKIMRYIMNAQVVMGEQTTWLGVHRHRQEEWTPIGVSRNQFISPNIYICDNFTIYIYFDVNITIY